LKLTKYKNKKGQDIPYLYRSEVGIFFVRKRFGDSTPRKSLDTNIESIAVQKIYDALKELEAEAKGEKFKKTNLLVKDYYQKMIEEKKVQEAKQSTLDRIDVVWRNHIEPYWANMTPSEVTKDNVILFMSWHRKDNSKVQFITTFKYLGNIFRLMVEDGAIPVAQVPKLEIPLTEQKHHKAPKGRFIYHEEFLNVRKHLTDNYRTLVDVAYYVGMRQMEIGALKSSEVIKKAGHYYFDLSWQTNKIGIARTPPIPEFLIEAILDLKKAGPYLFPMSKDESKHMTARAIFAAWKKAKIDAKVQGKMRFHDLRHTCATNLVKANINPLIIATNLGMTIKTLQERYLKLKSEDLLVVSRSMGELFERGKS
jgi:integrase